jgi:predicted nucleic acid-binding protein
MTHTTIFIDTSVLLSAAQSTLGASASIMAQCKKRVIYGVVSSYVIAEAKKNAVQKLDQKEKQRLHIFLQQGRLETGDDPTAGEIEKYARIIHPKDAPIIAAAVKNNVTILVTLDTTDFKKPAVREFVKPLKIMTPREFITAK